MLRTEPARVWLLLPLLLLGACDDDDITEPDGERFTAQLRASNEVPAPSGNVANATGSATFTIDDDTPTTVDFTLTATGLTTAVVGAHIHAPAAAGTNAPVVVDLLGAAGVSNAQFTSSGSASGSFTVSNISTGQQGVTTLDALLTLMRSGQAYVNVHTQTNPAGEVRGQIQLED